MIWTGDDECSGGIVVVVMVGGGDDNDDNDDNENDDDDDANIESNMHDRSSTKQNLFQFFFFVTNCALGLLC
jgi:hypothetical protein